MVLHMYVCTLPVLVMHMRCVTNDLHELLLLTRFMHIHAYGILNDFQLKLARGGNCVLSGQFIHKINSNASKVHVKCHYILS